jgi:hypothetical protein
VCPRAGLDDVEKRKFVTLRGLEFRPLGRQARSQSLYRLSYPGSLIFSDMRLNTFTVTVFVVTIWKICIKCVHNYDLLLFKISRT